MRVIEEMEQRLQSEDSMVRAQLLREDIERQRKLEALARRHETREAFAGEGLAIGWTRGNLRTHAVEEPLRALLAAVHAYERGGRTDDRHQEVRRAWDAFDHLRPENLVGCH